MMKMKAIRSHPIVLVTLFSAIFSLQAEAASDADYKEKILGQWKEEFVEGPATFKGFETYQRDGTLIADGMLSLQGQKIPIKLAGVWEIKNGTLIATLKKSNVPQMMPVGIVSKDKIVEINQTVFRYKTEDGELERKTRVPNSGIDTAETSKSTDHAMRLWTDSTGKFKIEATLKELKKGPPLQPYQAVLQKSDGSRVQIPLNRLSAADQDYLRRSSSTNQVTPKESPKPIAPATPAAPEIIKAPSNPKEQTAISEAIAKTFTIADLSMEMLWVKPGTFEMGSPTAGNLTMENTPHMVTLTQGFYLGKYEVTQAQWEEVMGNNKSKFKGFNSPVINKSKFKGVNLPVTNVSWDKVTSFCEKLTELERKAGRLPAGMAYQLPTEAQWEYACRAGSKAAFSFGDASVELHRHANYADVNADYDWSDKAHDDGYKNTSPVGSYKANAWGFHDMHGNVFEWCADWCGAYPTGSVRDPVGPADGSFRVYRGGSWVNPANYARSANRNRNVHFFSNFNLGFRLSLRPLASK